MRSRSIFVSLIFFISAACAPSVDLSAIPESPNGLDVYVDTETRKIRIVGSSTVAPFATTVAEQFGAVSVFPTPIVETTGTGGGFETFCQAIGPAQPSIVNASRPIDQSERQACAASGITELVEIKIGFDGIVLANAKTAASFDLTKEQIYLGLAAEIPDDSEGWIKNPHERWADISPNLPDLKILVSGPPSTSGTRDAFVSLAMESGAKTLPVMAALAESDPDAFYDRVHRLRSDGAWIDSGENDSAIVQTLLRNSESIGVLGFSFLGQNQDRIKGAKIDGVTPIFEKIANGNYKVSRSLYFYVKKQNIPYVPGLAEYVAEFTQQDVWGPSGYLAEKGLIPLPEAERQKVRQTALTLTPLAPLKLEAEN